MTTARNGSGGLARVARPLRAGCYARVSTVDQAPENQLAVLLAFAEARGSPSTSGTR